MKFPKKNPFASLAGSVLPPRGRPRKAEGAQTAAERKRHERQRKNDWEGFSFVPIIPHAGYLVIETSPEDEMAVFDIHRAHIVLGYELQRTMDAHHRDYPNQKSPADQPEQPGTESETELGEVTVLVLEYPDKVLYIAPAYEKPPSVGNTLAGVGLSSLNRGLFLADAPKGTGKLIGGWGHKKGYNANTSVFEPGLDDVSDFYADEFANEDDDTGPADNPGRFADQSNPEAELDEIVENYDQDNDDESENPHAADILKCRICQEVLEGDKDDSTLLLKHLEERHPDEYQRIGRTMADQFDKARETEKKKDRKRLEKQKHCREDHDGMFARQLKAHGPGFYECGTCGAPLCKGTHVKQVEEELAKRNAYHAQLSYLEQLDASKTRPRPIYCKYCRKPILVTEYEG